MSPSNGLAAAMTASAPAFRMLVVIPTLGQRLDTLVRTLASIHDQTGAPVDVVLVTRVASPELRAIADRFDAQLVCDDGGISAAVNAGFATARPEHRYGGWIGDDDMMKPGFLATAAGMLESRPDAVVAFGDCDYIDIEAKRLFVRSPPPLAPALLQFLPGLIKQEACVFRLAAVREVGHLNRQLRYAMDLDLLLRLRRVGAFVRARQVFAAFCWHPGSLTISNRSASLVEAQEIQKTHARGVVRLLFLMLKPVIWYVVLAANWHINRQMRAAAGSSGPAGKVAP
jgi:GT2 family glycosyltransferase